MDCPVCRVNLDRAEYEGATVFECPECSGYLIDQRRVILIKRSRERSQDELRAEMEAADRPDTEALIRCPKCRAAQMNKQLVRVENAGEFMLDTCKGCSVVWFDVGELARVQLKHEQSAKGREAEKFRQRTDSRTPEEKTAFDQEIADMRSDQGVLAAGVLGGVLMGLSIALFAVTLVLFLFGLRTLSGVVSVPFALCLGASILPRVGSPTTRTVTIVALAGFEIAFLVTLAFN